MKAIVLTEKPSVAKEIARVLKCNVKNKGYFEGSQYIVTWALGHLVTLAEPEDYGDQYKKWRLEDLPIIPERMNLKVIRQTSHQYRVVKDLMKRKDVNELVIATDAGREGELVARWIMEMANWKKPFKRLWISSQTDQAIREGFANLKPGTAYNPLYDAALCRAEADWLIGFNITRALTCKFNTLLTAGRVQTPTLALIVNREEEINRFVPVDYWTIQVNFGEYLGDWRDSNGNGRLFDYSKAEQIGAKVKGQRGVVKEVKIDDKSEPAPLAYDLTELQRDANRRFGMSAQKTLSVIQSLYERHKLVTYPRTDSRYISSDMVSTLPTRLKGMAVGPYRELIRPLLEKPLRVTKRLVDDSKVSDHHAIIPTEQTLDLAKLSVDEKNLYDLIARRFIAVLYPPYRYDQITLTTVVNGESFYSRGRVVKEMGWRVVTGQVIKDDGGDDDQTSEQILTMQKKGTEKPVTGLKVNKAKTKPPARYSEATLLTAMESPGKYIEDEELREAMKGSGLGTPATRADIIEKLLQTSYIERKGKELVPTSKGKQLISLVAPTLKTPELTAQWEQRLSDIAKGKARKGDFIADIRKNAQELVGSVVADNVTVYRADNITKNRCPVCNKYMLLENGKRGKILRCSDRECGHIQPEKQKEPSGLKQSKKEKQISQRLINKYSDSSDIGTSLGDLLKAAIEEKKDES